MIREVLQEKRVWRTSLATSRTRVCIALPCVNLIDGEIIEVLQGTLREHGLSSSSCIVYLGRLCADVDQVALRNTMASLQRRGFDLVVDVPDAASHGAELLTLTQYCALQKARSWGSGGPLPNLGTRGFGEIIAADLTTEEAIEMARQAGCVYGQGPVFAEAQTARSIASQHLRADDVLRG